MEGQFKSSMLWNVRKTSTSSRSNALLLNGNSHPDHIAAAKSKLTLICYDIKDEINKNRDRKEALAVSRIKANPKFFYSYAKSLPKIKSSISMLFSSNGTITTDRTKMADILQYQLTSVFSDPDSSYVKPSNFKSPSIDDHSDEIEFYMSDDHIIAAIMASSQVKAV